MINNAQVILWGSPIGAVSWLEDDGMAVFQYEPEFVDSGIQIAPLMMPLRTAAYSFPALSKETFKGLPGLLADSLPDRFGNALINVWLASQGRTPASFNPVERLCYIGSRGMGALEFKPAIKGISKRSSTLEIDKLVDLANQILSQRSNHKWLLTGKDDKKNIEDILRVGTSAGGARAKAILAWNPATNEFKSGQINLKPGFEHWIMKFDGVSDSIKGTLADSKGYGKIEYAYYLMAKEIGIEMTDCRLHKEGGRSHFMTKRFDRTEGGKKVHMQSLGAIAHFDYKQSFRYSYEQAILVMKQLKLSHKDLDQIVLRGIFNVIGKNCDDHVKNIAFIMNRQGKWKLAPAYDMIYAWNPSGVWTNQHQMSINGKREKMKREDLLKFAEAADIKKAKANNMIDRVIEIFSNWEKYADKAEIKNSRIKEIKKNLLTYI